MFCYIIIIIIIILYSTYIYNYSILINYVNIIFYNPPDGVSTLK